MPRSPKLDIDCYVGQRLRLRRQELGLTQAELGPELGITYQQLQKYEAGRDRISAGRLYQVAGILKVPLSYFFEGLQEPQRSSPATKKKWAVRTRSSGPLA